MARRTGAVLSVLAVVNTACFVALLSCFVIDASDRQYSIAIMCGPVAAISGSLSAVLWFDLHRTRKRKRSSEMDGAE